MVEIRRYVQTEHKRAFPYLSGEKIFNYWLYVIDSYTSTDLLNRNAITVAPDTHVIQASIKLGLLSDKDAANKNRQDIAKKWAYLLEGTGLAPIDIHTPLWLWSRAGFPAIK
ncbi:MAG: hypothetical protein R3C44_18540 [Chloroflexota bacterium]